MMIFYNHNHSIYKMNNSNSSDKSNSNPSSRIGSGKSTHTAASNSATDSNTSSSRPHSSKSARSRHSESSSQSLGAQMIQPWESVKLAIARILGPKVVASLVPPPLPSIPSSSSATSPPSDFTPSAALSADEAKQYAHTTPITISHGFQPIRIMETSKPGLRQVCYLQNSSTFVSLDKEFLQSWKGGLKTSRIPIIPPPIMSNKDATVSKFVDGFIGVTKWIYIDLYRVYIVANQQLELKVIDLNFKTISVASTPKPILLYVNPTIIYTLSPF